jgi:hypothetical protein
LKDITKKYTQWKQITTYNPNSIFFFFLINNKNFPFFIFSL